MIITCDHCGKKFERERSDVSNHTHHFCSRECLYARGTGWSRGPNVIHRANLRIDLRNILDFLATCEGGKATTCEIKLCCNLSQDAWKRRRIVLVDRGAIEAAGYSHWALTPAFRAGDITADSVIRAAVGDV